MALFNVVAGTRFYFGGAMADQATDFVEADFSSQTWVEVDGFQQMGELGEEPTMISTPVINRDRDLTMKGTYQTVIMENRFVVMETDPGQSACRAAGATKLFYAARIVFPTTRELMFMGPVVTREMGGEANDIRFLQVNIHRISNLVDVPA